MNNLGFLRIASCSPRVYLGDVKKNQKEIMAIIGQLDDVAIAVFPELALTGASVGSLLKHETLYNNAFKALINIVEKTALLDTLFIIGLPFYTEGRLYNCAAVFKNGEILGIVPKTHLNKAEKDIFSVGSSDSKVLVINDLFIPFGANLRFKNSDISFAINIGEDMFNKAKNANILFNLSSFTAGVGKNAKLVNYIKSTTQVKSNIWVYANAGFGESTTDNVYDGYCGIFEAGKVIAENKSFQLKSSFIVADCDIAKVKYKSLNSFVAEDDCTIDLPLLKESPLPLLRHICPKPFIPMDEDKQTRFNEICHIQTNALATRLEKTGIKNIVIGVSGGLDSTLALLVAVKTMQKLNLPNSHIHAITMPGFGTGKKTKNNADKLMELLNTTNKTVSIERAVSVHFDDIGHDPNKHDVTYENSQARERTQILMDYANMVGALVLGTGDLSEIALGWSTYNGDHMSMYNVNCSVPKTLIPPLIDFIAKDMGEAVYNVCLDVIGTPISPELLPTTEGDLKQKTEEIIGDYDLHDFFLYNLIDSGSSTDRLYAMAIQAFKGVYTANYIKEVLNKFISRFFSQQFKRNCSTDGPAIGSISLSPRGAWQMPSDLYNNLWNSINLSLNDDNFKA